MRVNGLNINRISIVGLFAAFTLAGLVACGSGEPGSGFTTGEGSDFELPCSSPFAGPGCELNSDAVFSTRPTCGDDDQTGIVDACGIAVSAIDLHEPVVMTMAGLTANTRHIIKITNPSAAEVTPAGGYIATSDADGEINKVTVVQNMAALPGSELGDYVVSVAEEATPATEEQSLTYTVEDRSRVQCVDGGSVAQASFLTSDSVFAQVTANTGSLADGTYDVYVQDDTRSALATGLSMGATALTVTVAGGTGVVDLGTNAVGAYDVVIDVNGNGNFDQNTDLISRQNRLHPCFVVQAASAGTANLQQIASDKNGNKREIFDPAANIPAIRDIQTSITPAKRSTVQQPVSVRTYLVAHQDTWAGGETLTDADAVSMFKTNPVQDFSNSESPWILTPLSALAGLGGVASCYDVVVDTDRDGVFDLGSDYVDNVDHTGDNTACGVRVATAGCNRVSITSHSDGEYFATETAVTLVGVITDTPTQSYLTVTSGNQSITLELTPDGATGAYTEDVPLFAGSNHITVSGIFADGSTCSRTITLERPPEVALFRAQLSWDQPVSGSYDMDLHVVEPSGIYTNGGSGGNGTDCNWSNCRIAADGTTSGIDWGVTDNELDDPALDVDCISGCARVENIFISNISNDGSYQVYVDAYSGTADNVIVTIFVLGTPIAQVDCTAAGIMASTTATDSCFVGTINWTGGSAGFGSFTPSGTTANDFP